MLSIMEILEPYFEQLTYGRIGRFCSLWATTPDESQSHELLAHKAYVDPSISTSIKCESKAGIADDNIVLQKLLRRWRYFDHQDGSSCVKDRVAKSLKRKIKKPCYVCGQFQHIGKKCPKRRNCSTCKKRGHIAHDCPTNNKEHLICLRCGESGHELFTCDAAYSPDDLKNVQCYVCKELGHLCCDNNTDINPAAASCYNCGDSGHSGLQCPKPHLDKFGSRPPPICYKCGEDDHVARKCIKDPGGLSSRHKCQQASEIDLDAEAEDASEYEKRKPARRRRTYRHGTARKRKLKRLLEYMSV